MVEGTDNPARVRLQPAARQPAPIGAAQSDRPVRLAGGIAAVVLALAIALIVFVPAARGQLLVPGAGLFAAGALVAVARNLALSRRTRQPAGQGPAARRYTTAIEQLGSGRLEVRIAGIYALERVARDSAGDHPAVMEALAAFIRDYPGKPLRRRDRGRREHEQRVRRDVQAALDVIRRRKQHRDIRPVDLTGADLTGADLTGADLAGADLAGAQLSGANLAKTRLHRASLHGAHLPIASLTRADLTGADLTGADLRWAYLTGADLADADLTGADLTGADLTGADLMDARWPRHAAVPEAWKADSATGRLAAAGTDAGPAQPN